MSSPDTKVFIPSASQFRGWLMESLRILDVKPSPFAKGSGAAINSATKFINGVQADVRLETASLLYTHAQKLAAQKGCELPALKGAENLNQMGSQQ